MSLSSRTPKNVRFGGPSAPLTVLGCANGGTNVLGTDKASPGWSPGEPAGFHLGIVSRQPDDIIRVVSHLVGESRCHGSSATCSHHHECRAQLLESLGGPFRACGSRHACNRWNMLMAV